MPMPNGTQRRLGIRQKVAAYNGSKGEACLAPTNLTQAVNQMHQHRA